MDFSFLEQNKIYHTNCLDLIKLLPDNYIDAIITDFPYGIDYQSNYRKEKFNKIRNDEKPYVEWIAPSYQKLKDGGRLICFYRYDVQEELIYEIEQAGYIIKSQLVWDKGNWSAGDLESSFGIEHELMIYATKGVYKFKNGRPHTVYHVPRVDGQKMIHPNEKPIQLNQALIRDITEINELIFEPFSGSGSLCVAAKIEGRNFIACDLDINNVNTGNQRVKSTTIGLF